VLQVSLGVAPVDGRLDAESTLRLALSAVRAAKSGGRNRIVNAQDLDEAAAAAASEMRAFHRLREALRLGSFELAAQPVIDLGTGAISFWEILLRLPDADGRLLTPDSFLPIAQRFGLMPEIDGWVFDRAVEALVQQPDLRLSVNLSGISLRDETLLRHVETTLAARGIQPGRLIFEITETVALTDLSFAREWIERLRVPGCQIALDDFGTGFTSFAYLRALPADYVKLDGSFVRTLDCDATSQGLVATISSAAQLLGKSVIAEMVESEAIADRLRDLGIEYGQGYHWGRPVPLSTVDARRARLHLTDPTAAG